MFDRHVIVPVAGMLMIIVLSIGVPLVRALARRWELEGARPKIGPLTPDVANRLERIEQAVESIAVEVERISEGQRFTTRLLSERGADPVRIPVAGDRSSA